MDLIQTTRRIVTSFNYSSTSWDIPEIILLLCGNPPPKQPFWGGVYKISNIFSNFVLNEIIQKERAIWLNFDLLVMFIWFLNTSRWKCWLSKKIILTKIAQKWTFHRKLCKCLWNAWSKVLSNCWSISWSFAFLILFFSKISEVS